MAGIAIMLSARRAGEQIKKPLTDGTELAQQQ
jgi:hypothetical protein